MKKQTTLVSISYLQDVLDSLYGYTDNCKLESVKANTRYYIYKDKHYKNATLTDIQRAISQLDDSIEKDVMMVCIKKLRKDLGAKQ